MSDTESENFTDVPFIYDLDFIDDLTDDSTVDPLFIKEIQTEKLRYHVFHLYWQIQDYLNSQYLPLFNSKKALSNFFDLLIQ